MLELELFQSEFSSKVYNYETEQLEFTSTKFIKENHSRSKLLWKRRIWIWVIYTFISIDKWWLKPSVFCFINIV